jgi:hypothetical protein
LADPRAKAAAFNGVLALLKAVESDSATCVLVFRALNKQLRDPARAAHFFAVPYQFMRWCCAEGDAEGVRTALQAVAMSAER